MSNAFWKFLHMELQFTAPLHRRQPRVRKTTATVTNIRLLSSEDRRRFGSFPGKRKGKWNAAYVSYCVDGHSYFSQRKIPIPADKDIGSQVTVWYAVLFPDTPTDPPSYVKPVLYTLLSLLMFLAGFLL